METSFGTFLKQKRQEKNLTQKELAKLLIVSESAVSKWEKDVAHPDISLLPKLSEILDVTEHELITASIDKKTREEKKQAKNWRAFSLSWNLFFYISYAIALITCFVCNLAINKTLSWFWIVVCALLIAFTFTNLPKLIKKHKLLLLPLCIFLSLCLLLGACCLYSGGNWFWIATVPVFFSLVILFIPIYIAKYKVFEKIKNYNSFISIGIDFIVLNILLFIIDLYSVNNNFTTTHWYLNIALPIAVSIYLILNLFLCIKFLKTNKLLKTSIILLLVNFFVYIVPLFIKVNSPYIQLEIDSLNVFKSNFLNWQNELTIERNIHCLIFLTLLTLTIVFYAIGLVLHIKRKRIKNQNKN